MSLYTSSHIYTDKTMEGIDNDVTFRVEKRSTCRWSMTFHMRASVFSRWPEAICSAVMGAPCSSCMRTPDLLKLSIATSQLCARFLGMWQGNLIFCGHQRDLSIKLITLKSALEKSHRPRRSKSSETRWRRDIQIEWRHAFDNSMWIHWDLGIIYITFYKPVYGRDQQPRLEYQDRGLTNEKVRKAKACKGLLLTLQHEW